MHARALLALTAFATAIYSAPPALANTGSTYFGAPAEALNDPNCRLQRQNRAMIGGAIGAAIGAVLGNNIAARNAQAEGSTLGGLVGAGAGALAGRNSAPCNAQYQQPQPYGQSAYGEPQGAYPPPPPAYPEPGYRGDYPLAGGPDYRAGPHGDGACRWGEVATRDAYGREHREPAYMCRAPDGTWRIQR
jgi:hypothetical protein